MGLNSKTKTPCGFCFVEYFDANDALESVAVLSGTVLDARTIRVELDFGFKNGRHFGRGATGGQVRDDRRGEFDPGRSWAASEASATTSVYGPSGGRSTSDGAGGTSEQSGAADKDREGDVGGGEKRGRGRREYDEDNTVGEAAEAVDVEKDADQSRRRPSQGGGDDEDEGTTPRAKRRRRANSDDDDDEDEDDEDDERPKPGGGASESTGGA
mmetsp:Transcript_65610/g.112782  ORF Transcript_65610/g.112782 Transcript_65610/m.112782 type:complete len:213 (-) Transcript_65610:16-654(-)